MLNALKTLFVVLFSQLPLLAAAFTWWQEVTQRPIVAALLAVLYDLANQATTVLVDADLLLTAAEDYLRNRGVSL